MNLDRRHLRDKRLGTACFWACFLIRTWGDGSVWPRKRRISCVLKLSAAGDWQIWPQIARSPEGFLNLLKNLKQELM